MSYYKNYKIFNTTADMGISVRGRSINELIINSAIGFSETLGKIKKNKNIEKTDKKIKIKFTSYENLLVQLLNELLYIFEAEDLYLIGVKKNNLTNKEFFAIFEFGKISNNNFIYKNSIKAVTYHNIKIIKKRKYFYVDILMDV